MAKKFFAVGMMMGLLTFLAVASPALAKEKYPNLDKAIHALEAAKGDLNKAPHDFGGHKADALAACDEAIKQLGLAKQFRNEANAMKANEAQQGH